MYYKCKKCLYIIKISKEAKRACIKCGNNSEEDWYEYPVPAALGFLEQAEVNIYGSDEFSLYNFHELQSSCLFLCALYEILLEGLISDLMCSIGTPDSIINIVIDSNQGQEKLSKIFKRLTGISIKDGISLAEELDFYNYLKEVITGRNQYIHGSYSALDNIGKEKLEYICSSIIDIFIVLHNRYVFKI